jgi:hypothetical protein
MNNATICINGETHDIMISEERKFSTGSTGFNASGKMEFKGKRYQIGINVIEIGSKPQEKKKVK